MTPDELRAHARHVLRRTLPRMLDGIHRSLEIIEGHARNAGVGMPEIGDIRGMLDAMRERALGELGGE